MLFMTIILAMVDPDLFRSISAPRATAQGCQVLPAKNVLPTYRSKSTQNVLEAAQVVVLAAKCIVCVCVCVLTRYFMLKCNVIQCSRKRTLSTYAFGDWVGSQINVFPRWYCSVTGFGRKGRAFWEGVPGVSFRAGVLVVVVFRWSCACLSDCGIQ